MHRLVKAALSAAIVTTIAGSQAKAQGLGTFDVINTGIFNRAVNPAIYRSPFVQQVARQASLLNSNNRLSTDFENKLSALIGQLLPGFPQVPRISTPYDNKNSNQLRNLAFTISTGGLPAGF
jgi:hypothetical protein